MGLVSGSVTWRYLVINSYLRLIDGTKGTLLPLVIVPSIHWKRGKNSNKVSLLLLVLPLFRFFFLRPCAKKESWVSTSSFAVALFVLALALEA
jgi:hypothetical protein